VEDKMMGNGINHRSLSLQEREKEGEVKDD
jgi:hypothetical protein